MIYSTVCLIADFSQIQKNIIESHKLNQIAYLDFLTGLPNRNGCDVIISKYSDQTDVASFGCALIELPTIDEINLSYGRLFGDKYINDFARIFDPIGSKYGFVGRNSGNEFLLIIENCPYEKMHQFSTELNSSIDAYNEKHKDPVMTIKLNYILNEQEGLKNFLSIISTLYSRERSE
ncbi:MAG: GGDEF domain-containing protein [Lachnospiraceae bacterium]|nr:GGDEF domain-containing protein [Lachnospiraceae bacterium]